MKDTNSQSQSVDSNRLTEQRFWEDYWKNLRLPCVVDQNFSFDRCLSVSLLNRLAQLPAPRDVHDRRTVLEIGAAPGKWLSLFPQNLYAVSGIEYSQQGIDALRRNMALLGIEPLELIHGDFFEIEPRPEYDIVMSLGFVEHFDDPVEVIRRHVAWLKPGGALVIGVPNFTGLHGMAQRLLDMSILKAHNTTVMDVKFFDVLPDQIGVEKWSVEYLGSFEPALPLTYRQKSLSNILPKIVLRLASYLRRWRGWDSVNSPFISSYLLGIYRKYD
jgi:2-polyprenyl-3-methyl-5-hydroxy-6-metoxy-1,4-benzoquinol methylase